MLTLALPWWLLLLPLPALVWWLVPPYRTSRQGLVVPFLGRLARLLGQQPSAGATVSRGTLARWLVLWGCWACVVVAIARPQVIEPPVSRDIPVRDMLLAVDLSGSMATQDFTDAQGQSVDRLAAVKQVLDGFLARRQGDRVGLIFFGSAAFVQAPFTEDLDVVRELLDEAQVRMAGPQTAFGDALGLAINVFDRSSVDEKVLIALTDGNDTASQVPPEKAAQIAHDKGIVIHTVAVGDPKAAGEDALDEVTLQRVASSTGGIYSHAADRQQLEAIYDQLDALETRKVQTQSHRPRRDVYWWALAAALGLSMLYMGLGVVRQMMAGRGQPDEGPGGATLVAASPMLLAAPLAFHFIRPEWLLLLLPVAWLWWRLRRHADGRQAWRGIVAPHLLEHLLGGQEKARRFGPLEWLGLAWLLAILAIAGPTWKHEPSPFADDTAALAIVVRVTPSMITEDVQPSRLERATQKIHDLLQQRGNARTALVAYAGSAHLVMPATRDGGIIDSFAGSLSPDIMPVSGDVAAEALALADSALAAAGGGSIVWMTDGVAQEQAAALADWRGGSGTDLRLWTMLLPGDEQDALRAAARPARAEIVSLTADDSDVQAVARAARFANVTGADGDTRWAESGYWLTPLIALALLPFFRRGWLVPAARTVA
ncbi:VWA domain-containing protein [Marinihelvus fidelis]|uniref:VWA domain-containing protein n=1 Tax=Marinihelvus fidelis TaxID=2613842 RepID=A0A5N0TFZ4_9GAMM|nr:VWA domain-containing protein [Marinihelvus fidelis]KAA9133531.1 VWA domain-containing protein [Marinihelvus fidelis]